MRVKAMFDEGDGGCTLLIEDLTEDETRALLTEGFVSIITKMAKEEELRRTTPALLRKETE